MWRGKQRRRNQLLPAVVKRTTTTTKYETLLAEIQPDVCVEQPPLEQLPEIAWATYAEARYNNRYPPSYQIVADKLLRIYSGDTNRRAVLTLLPSLMRVFNTAASPRRTRFTVSRFTRGYGIPCCTH